MRSLSEDVTVGMLMRVGVEMMVRDAISSRCLAGGSWVAHNRVIWRAVSEVCWEVYTVVERELVHSGDGVWVVMGLVESGQEEVLCGVLELCHKGDSHGTI